MSQDLTPLQTMRTLKFYLLWVMIGLMWTTVDFVLGVYKTSAFEEVTGDDHFLSAVRSVGLIVYTVNHPLWGSMGKSFGYKSAFVLYGAIQTSTLFTFYATSVGGKAMILIWYCLVFFPVVRLYTQRLHQICLEKVTWENILHFYFQWRLYLELGNICALPITRLYSLVLFVLHGRTESSSASVLSCNYPLISIIAMYSTV